MGDFRLIARLGGGGAGEVWKAEDVALGRAVALKTLVDGGEEGVLEGEARHAASVAHPVLAAVFGLARVEGKRCLVMELVEGETLAERLREGALGVRESVGLALRVADALAFLHARGLVHGDVKPANLILTDGVGVKLVDFGLARRGGVRDEGRSGTLGYAAPELVRGEACDGKADVFALGVVLYEMLAGRSPFPGAWWAERRDVLLRREPASLGATRRDVPLELADLVRRALAKDAAARPTASALRDGLARVETLLAPVVAPSPLPVPAPPARRMSWLARVVRRSAPAAATSARGAAFRGLLPFLEADRDRFFGRDVEVSALLDRVTAADLRFGVLHGESGSGKTSLLRAGLVPRLWEAGFVPITVRSHRDPLEAVLEGAALRSGLTREEREAPESFLARVASRMGGPVVVIADQFEEFFIQRPRPEEREPFLSLLGRSMRSAGAPVRFLLALRSDFLHLIATELSSVVDEPLLSSRLSRLRPLGEEMAAEIIERSAEKASLPLEPGLARQVAADLAVGGVVLPSELQIVGEQLQAKGLFTRAAYRRAGGKEVLVHLHLEEVLRETEDRHAAALVLHTMISDEGTRRTLTLEEIVKRSQRGRAVVERILRRFVAARLVREVQEDEPWRYELMHEYLIEKIHRVAGKLLDATQRANQLLKRYGSSYAVDPRTRIPLLKIVFVRRYSDLPLDARTRELLRKSVVSGTARTGAIAALVLAFALGVAALLSVQETWTTVRLFDGHTAAVRGIAVSPDGRLLASASEDGSAIIWDFASRRRLATLRGHAGFVLGVAFSNDGRLLATGGIDKLVVIWDVATHQPVSRLIGHRSELSSVQFLPDGNLLSMARNETIVWSVRSWTKLRELPVGGMDAGLALVPKSSRFVYVGIEWDAESGARIRDLYRGAPAPAFSQFSPDGGTLIGVDSKGEVAFLGTASGTLARRPRTHRDHGRVAAVSHDGLLAVSGADDLVLWDLPSRRPLARLQHSSIVWKATFTPDDRYLVSAHGDGSLLVWDITQRRQAVGFSDHGGGVRAVAFSPEGGRLLSGSEDGSVIVWNVAQGRKEVVLQGHETRVNGVAVSREGSWALTCDQAGRTARWDLRRASRLWTDDNEGANYGVAVSPDGRLAASTRAAHDGASGRWLYDFGREGGVHLYSVDFSPDGSLLCGVGPNDGGTICLWESVRRKMVERRTEAANVVAVSFGPDGKTLVTGGDDGAVRLWNVRPLRELALLGRHTARVKSVDFSPDGTHVASAGDDRMLALWDVKRRRLVTRIGTHTSPVLAVAFSPDGRQIASGEHDHSVQLATRHRELWGRRLD